MKIRAVGTKLFHASRQADGHEEAKIRFSQFCEHAKKRFSSAISVIRFRRSCSCVIGLRQAVVLSRLQQGVWSPLCKQGEDDR